VGAAGTNGGASNIQFGQGSRSSGAQNAVNYGYAQGGTSATKAPAAGTNGGSSGLSTPGAPPLSCHPSLLAPSQRPARATPLLLLQHYHILFLISVSVP